MLIVLMGGSCSGKDSLQTVMSEILEFPICVSHTSRPMRESEINHKTYHFITLEEFKTMYYNEEFLEYRSYNVAGNDTWFYGLHRSEVDSDEIKIVIVDQKGYYELVKQLGKDKVIGFYIHAPERVKINRALSRETRTDDTFYLEFYRRMADDLKAFELVKNDEFVYKIENLDIDQAIVDIELCLYRKGVLL